MLLVVQFKCYVPLLFTKGEFKLGLAYLQDDKTEKQSGEKQADKI